MTGSRRRYLIAGSQADEDGDPHEAKGLDKVEPHD